MANNNRNKTEYPLKTAFNTTNRMFIISSPLNIPQN